MPFIPSIPPTGAAWHVIQSSRRRRRCHSGEGSEPIGCGGLIAGFVVLLVVIVVGVNAIDVVMQWTSPRICGAIWSADDGCWPTAPTLVEVVGRKAIDLWALAGRIW
jgi:hypothetical protein